MLDDGGLGHHGQAGGTERLQRRYVCVGEVAEEAGEDLLLQEHLILGGGGRGGRIRQASEEADPAADWAGQIQRALSTTPLKNELRNEASKATHHLGKQTQNTGCPP